MTAAERAIELLAEMPKLPGLQIIRDGSLVPRDELQCNAELLQLVVRYRYALQDLVVETAALQRAAARDSS